MIHREGTVSLLLVLLLFTLLSSVSKFMGIDWLFYLLVGVGLFLLIFLLQFFRNPKREIKDKDENLIYAPADGRVVVIEETEENEYFNEKKKLVSIFMSPLNVHANRSPISGKIKYDKYHKGKYLVAWHPKSSTENERTTIVIEGKHGEILLRQIAGALARRIKYYVSKNDKVGQGQEFGFIKLGSRVDIYLPLTANVMVEKEQMVKGNIDVIAKFTI